MEAPWIPGCLAPQESLSSEPRSDIFVKTKMCKFNLLGACTKGAACMFAHAANELNPVPDLFRTKICRMLINTGTCDDPECKYAHNKEELRTCNTAFKQKERQSKEGRSRLKEQTSPSKALLPPGQVASSIPAPCPDAPGVVSAGRVPCELPVHTAARRGRRGSGHGGRKSAEEPMHPGPAGIKNHQELEGHDLSEKKHRQRLESEDQRPEMSSTTTSENECKECSSSTAATTDDFSGGRRNSAETSQEEEDPEVSEPPMFTRMMSCPLPQSGPYETVTVNQEHFDTDDELIYQDTDIEAPKLSDLMGYITVKNTFLEFEPKSSSLRTVRTAAGRLEMMARED